LPARSPSAVFFRNLDPRTDPFRAFRALKGKGPGALLESARASQRSGRWSFAAGRPTRILRAKGRRVELRGPGGRRVWTGDPFDALARELGGPCEIPPGAPPFFGGAIGVVGYEAKNLLEPHLPQTAADDLGLPDLCFLFFDEGVAFDAAAGRATAFRVERGGSARTAGKRLDAIQRVLRAPLAEPVLPRTPSTASVRRSTPREAFLDSVKRAKRHIRAGDVFQVNLSQRLDFPLAGDGLSTYARLRKLNPSSFFGFFDAGDFRLVSGSPERLARLDGGTLETRPIAGTRPRGETAAADSALTRELLLSPKERAEHVMLVDLERNDLGRVCEYGSVAVDELMTLEEYSHVKHIVSNVSGTLRRGYGPVDALKAVFPGGTITGAPKVRCMEIIDALEPVARGAYTGSLGYVSYSGSMDFNIIIRSLVLKAGRAYLQAGAGIVADSVPEREHDETLYKAEAVLSAVFGAVGARGILRRLGARRRASR